MTGEDKARIFIDRNLLKRIYVYKRCSQDDTARKFMCSQWVISNRLRQYGITSRAKTCNLSNRRYGFNRNFFKSISSDAAWILGLLVSDGFVRKNNASAYFGLKLSERDKDVLFKVRDILKYGGPIHRVVTRLEYKGKVKTFGFRLLQICSIETVKDLERIGIMQAKTHKETMPGCIKDTHDESIMSSFIRGVFDGDGSILFDAETRSMCFQIVGARRLLRDIQNYLMWFCDLKKTKLTQNVAGTNHFALRYRGNGQVARIMDWIYSSSSLSNRMDRKFIKFHNVRRIVDK